MSGTLTSAADQANPVVVFDGVKYDVIAAPEDVSPLVRSVRTGVLQTLDIDRLVNHLDRTNDLLHIAACGVAGLVHPETGKSLSARVMGLQYKLRTRTGEIATALLSLGESARSMLATLRSALRDLYSLHEDDAVTRLMRCGPVALKMRESAGKLEADFQGLLEEAGAVLQLTSETYARRQHEGLSMQERHLEVKASVESIKTKRAALEIQMRELETLRQEMKAKRATADEGVLTPPVVRPIATAFGRGIGGGLSLDMASLEVGSELAAALAQEPSVYAAPKEALAGSAAAPSVKGELIGSSRNPEDAEREALDAMTEHALRLGEARDNDALEEAAVVSLHHAVMTLQQIVVVLAEHKRLWSQVGMDYARLAQADLRTNVEECMQRARAERIEAYSEPGFQACMLSVAAQWHALQLIAAEYRSAIQTTYTKMGRTYAKNPTIEEARQLAPALGTALAQGVAAEIRLLNERTGKTAPEQQGQPTVIEQTVAGGRPKASGADSM